MWVDDVASNVCQTSVAGAKLPGCLMGRAPVTIGSECVSMTWRAICASARPYHDTGAQQHHGAHVVVRVKVALLADNKRQRQPHARAGHADTAFHVVGRHVTQETRV